MTFSSVEIRHQKGEVEGLLKRQQLNMVEAEMNRLVRKFGKYNVAAFIIMGVGVIIFLLTPLLLWLFDFDSDILGVLIFLIGLLMWVVGFIVRKLKGNKQK